MIWPMRVPVTDPAEIEAVKRGDIDGEIYRDGGCWAERWQLELLRSGVLTFVAPKEQEGES